jgi:hypothetical protein
MKVFIPSKDRACQLDLLLRSMEQNLPNMNFDVHVVYMTSNKDFDKGYDKLFATKYKNINLTQEYEACFESDFDYYLSKDTDGYVMLLTDDSVFYRKNECSEDDLKDIIKDNVWCFSFRLGLNTTTQWYRTGQQQEHLDKLGYKIVTPCIISSEMYIQWNWKIRPPFENYGYMMSWDGHIYRTADLLSLSRKFTYYNPRTFEDRATKNPANRESIDRKFMISPDKSCLFVNTINITQEEGVPCGDKYHYPLDYLNEQYLSNKKISMESFNNLEIHGSHEEVPLIFE